MIGHWANNLFQISTLCLGLAAAMSNVTTEVSEADPAVTVGYGVAQPVLATKDVVILVSISTLSHGTFRHLLPPVQCPLQVFMFLLWAYSLLLTYRAWYRILYSDGDEGSNMWRSGLHVTRDE